MRIRFPFLCNGDDYTVNSRRICGQHSGPVGKPAVFSVYGGAWSRRRQRRRRFYRVMFENAQQGESRDSVRWRSRPVRREVGPAMLIVIATLFYCVTIRQY